jgi:predicted dehydrogenase
MNRKLKVVVIGAGGIARGPHLGNWKKMAEVDVIGVADINLEAAKAAATQHNIPHAFSDYRDLLKLKPDIADICAPNIVHTPAALAALAAGCHVLCEKPLAVTTGEVRKIGQLADRKKRKLMTAQHHRFSAPALAIRGWAGTGGLGDVYHARVRAMRRAWLPARPSFIQKKISGGGPCMDIGVHALDACMWIMDFPRPVRVSGVSKTIFAKGHQIPGKWGEWDRKKYDVEDFAAGFIHFDNGATMTLESSWLGHQQEDEDMSFQLFGTKGGVKWPSAEFATVHGKTFAQGTLTHPKNIASAYEDEIRAFHDCVVNNKPSPVPWTQTIKVIAILESVYRSQDTGREVKVRL